MGVRTSRPSFLLRRVGGTHHTKTTPHTGPPAGDTHCDPSGSGLSFGVGRPAPTRLSRAVMHGLGEYVYWEVDGTPCNTATLELWCDGLFPQGPLPSRRGFHHRRRAVPLEPLPAPAGLVPVRHCSHGMAVGTSTEKPATHKCSRRSLFIRGSRSMITPLRVRWWNGCPVSAMFSTMRSRIGRMSSSTATQLMEGSRSAMCSCAFLSLLCRLADAPSALR